MSLGNAEGFSFERLADKKVVCGVCRSKVNMGGTLYTLAYGNPCAV